MTKYNSISITKRGFTLVELMLSVAIICIITPAVTLLMVQTMRGFTGYEAEMQLRITNQATLNRIYLRLGSCKRIFDSTSDAGFLAALDFNTSVSPYGVPPAKLAGYALPNINESGSLAYGTSNFLAANVGNCLFFANNDTMPTLLSGTSTVKVDVYRFNFYYLSDKANPRPISAAPCYSVVEWQSVQFADYDQVMSIWPATRQQNTVKALYAMGIQYAWDANSTDPGSSFYNLLPGGGTSSSGGGANSVPMRRYTVLTKMMTGVIIGGFRYGVSSNSSLWTGKVKCPKTIPQYAVESSPFPGGFEVAISGLSAGRSVLIRSVLVAQGSMPSVIADDLETVAMARDAW